MVLRAHWHLTLPLFNTERAGSWLKARVGGSILNPSGTQSHCVCFQGHLVLNAGATLGETSFVSYSRNSYQAKLSVGTHTYNADIHLGGRSWTMESEAARATQ